jgi:hypothetical protein
LYNLFPVFHHILINFLIQKSLDCRIKDKIDELNQIGDELMDKLKILIKCLTEFKARKNSDPESFSEIDFTHFEKLEKAVSKFITMVIDYDERLESLKRVKAKQKILSSEERDKKHKRDSKKLFNQVLKEIQQERKEREKNVVTSRVEILTKEEINLMINELSN